MRWSLRVIRRGFRRACLYGFLKMETNLGANTGQCTYDEVEKGAYGSVQSIVEKE
jgi:hypothetical protein